jgi:PAP2 superfamily
VFDAVNGIVREYEPYFVTERAPGGARAEAAVAGAAYTTLVALYPAQTATFDAELAASLATIPGSDGKSQSIARGLAWGEHVANLVLALRSLDGFSATLPGYFGGTGPGVWRSLPTATNPDGTLAAVFPQYRFVVPFAMTSPDQFRPGPPPALTSVEYATDVNEVKAIGRVDSTTRTTEQTQLAQLWQAVSIADLFRGTRADLPHKASLVDNARLFALLSITSCDALIAAFDAKYTYNLWRPYHAIRLADTDGNALTDPDPTWTSLVFPPRHQEYLSAHCVATGGFMRVLSRVLGDKHTFTLSSPGFPSFTWTFNRFSDAAAQVKEARIWAGIHFRNSCNVGAAQRRAWRWVITWWTTSYCPWRRAGITVGITVGIKMGSVTSRQTRHSRPECQQVEGWNPGMSVLEVGQTLVPASVNNAKTQRGQPRWIFAQKYRLKCYG